MTYNSLWWFWCSDDFHFSSMKLGYKKNTVSPNLIRVSHFFFLMPSYLTGFICHWGPWKSMQINLNFYKNKVTSMFICLLGSGSKRNSSCVPVNHLKLFGFLFEKASVWANTLDVQNQSWSWLDWIISGMKCRLSSVKLTCLGRKHLVNIYILLR